jgi:Polyketide cyclase / dehydrase and lipid transport
MEARMLMWIVYLIIAAFAAVLIAAVMKPKTFAVVREADINAPPVAVLALINDFHEWPKWSPWEKMDPALTRTHEGAAAGKGAVYSWSGNKKVGQGRMEITGTSPSHTDIDLHFIKPFEARNKTVFKVTPASDGSHVRWEMTGQSPFMFRVMGLFMNMDEMIGKDFASGLANMKQAAETA